MEVEKWVENGNLAIIQSSNGVTIRQWSSEKTAIRINFYYRGVRCFETLKLEARVSNLKYASRLRGKILNAIERE
ncbi:MAG: DUF3596 domain-containing protein [Tatlockia sp.]|nr:DUF3596 domain-containing protein [Tatlockia sp.]